MYSSVEVYLAVILYSIRINPLGEYTVGEKRKYGNQDAQAKIEGINKDTIPDDALRVLDGH